MERRNESEIKECWKGKKKKVRRGDRRNNRDRREEWKLKKNERRDFGWTNELMVRGL